MGEKRDVGLRAVVRSAVFMTILPTSVTSSAFRDPKRDRSRAQSRTGVAASRL